MRIPDLLKSRKFWAAGVGVAVAIFGNRAGMSEEQVQNAVYTLIAFILGTGLQTVRKPD